MRNRIAAILARIAAPEANPPWGVLDIGNVLSVLLISTLLVGPTIAQVFLNHRPVPIILLVGWTLGSILAVLYTLFIFRNKPESREALQLRPPSDISLPLVMFFGLGVAILFDLIGFVISQRFLATPELGGAVEFDILGWIAAVVFMVFAQPAAEETVFRGVALPKLRATLGGWGGVMLCAAIYATYHAIVYPPASADIVSYWYAIGAPFLAGIFFSGVRVYTGSTVVAGVAHAAFGLFAVLKAFALL